MMMMRIISLFIQSLQPINLCSSEVCYNEYRESQTQVRDLEATIDGELSEFTITVYIKQPQE